METCIDNHLISWHCFVFVVIAFFTKQFEHLCYTSWQGGEKGVFYKVLNGKALSQGPLPLTLLFIHLYHFDRNGTSFNVSTLHCKKGKCAPLKNLFKNTASLFYSLGKKLINNIIESLHSG